MIAVNTLLQCDWCTTATQHKGGMIQERLQLIRLAVPGVLRMTMLTAQMGLGKRCHGSSTALSCFCLAYGFVVKQT